MEEVNIKRIENAFIVTNMNTGFQTSCPTLGEALEKARELLSRV